MTARPITSSNGTTLAATDLGGNGAPIVLPHGLGMTQKSTVKLAEHLTAPHRVVTYDMRGHGDSADRPWSLKLILGGA